MVDAPIAAMSCADGRTVARFTGDIDLVGADAIRAAVQVALAAGDSTLVLDLSEVTFFDSQGVNAIARARAELAARDSRLVLRSPSAPVLAVLRITALDTVLSIES